MDKTAKYLIRLDDACPTIDVKKWTRFETLFDQYNVKPIIAVIPSNENPNMISVPPNENFWSDVRNWKNKGYEIALHGYNHIYGTQKSGLLKLNNRSEFAGVSLSKQKEKIRMGIKIFRDNGIEPRIWIAPAHSFDRNTLVALTDETDIKLISDGLAVNIFNRYGFTWLPQQLWAPLVKKSGLWTICCHPNTISSTTFEKVQRFIHKNHLSFTNVGEIIQDRNVYRKEDLGDRIYRMKFYLKKWGVRLYKKATAEN